MNFFQFCFHQTVQRSEAVEQPALEPAPLRRSLEIDKIELILVKSLTGDRMQGTGDFPVRHAECEELAFCLLLQVMLLEELEQLGVVQRESKVAAGRDERARNRAGSVPAPPSRLRSPGE